jgi:hypothetical protein
MCLTLRHLGAPITTMRGRARPWVAALLALAVALLTVFSLEHHGVDESAAHADVCGLCLLAHAQEPPAAGVQLEPPRLSDAVWVERHASPYEGAAPCARARGPPPHLA